MIDFVGNCFSEKHARALVHLLGPQLFLIVANRKLWIMLIDPILDMCITLFTTTTTTTTESTISRLSVL